MEPRQRHIGEERDFEETEWTEEAACAGHPTEVFFVDVGKSSNIPIAKAICRSCPVQKECLDYALRQKEEFGVWGGATPAERNNILRLRAIGLSHVADLTND